MYKNKLLGGVAGDCSEEFSGRPLYQSYEVDVDGVMFAGEYPGDRDEEVARRKIAQMHSFGIRHIVDLTEEGELCPYSHLLPSDMTHYRFPIKDVSVPKDMESVRALIQRIDELKALGGYVYIHCWGGVGRTGTIVACYISQHDDSLNADQVLAKLRGYFAMMPKSSRRKTPDSRAQVGFIKRFVEGNESFVEQRNARAKDAVRGSLMAGAAGDALGYAVEFNSRSSILARYGERGITQFALNAEGKALISDDTQMTLFTANGLLNATHLQMEPQCAVARAYVDWYYTQIGKPNRMKSCWISDIDALHSLRAPGDTCMSALDAITRGQEPCNNSKGCGGVMRVAPVGLFAHSKSFPFKNWKDGDLIKLGAECAKITHGHPAGWFSAGLFAHLIYEIVGRSMYKRIDRVEFEHIVGTAGHYMVAYFNSSQEYVYPLLTMILKALELAKQDISDVEAIAQLGEGWTGDEALAIAIYCAMRHLDSVEDAIIASVNHDGDSDSTGSVCGNIMGAIYGYEHIKERNIFCPEGCTLEDVLELSEVTLAIADDLYTGCIIGEYCRIDTPEKRQWKERYCSMIPSGISTSGINN